MALGKPPVLNVSYKPQKISPKSQGTVRMLLHDKIRDAYIHPQFVTDVIKPLQVEQLFDQEVGVWPLWDSCPWFNSTLRSVPVSLCVAITRNINTSFHAKTQGNHCGYLGSTKGTSSVTKYSFVVSSNFENQIVRWTCIAMRTGVV